MTLKDDGGDTISKNVLDWLTRVGAIATILATILGLFFPEDNAKKIAFIVAGVLAIGSGAVYFYQRRRAARLKIAESLEPLAPSATLRGLLPFEEGDPLPGRSRDVLELYTLIASSSFRFGVLWGESGCGKTSLLRAGLIPKLKNEHFLPLYIARPTKNPSEALRSALLKTFPKTSRQSDRSLNQLLKSTAPKGRKIIILFDQFEEFFLTNRTPHSRLSFIKWLGETIQKETLPVVFLISIRSDFFAQLQNFAPQIPEPTSIQTTYQLQNFDTEQAKQIFNTAAKADGISFEPELIQAVIRDLEVEEFIRPAELQVVGTRLKRKNVFTLNKYEALGGAKGILSSYISDEIKQSLNEQASRLILRLMCADVVETKSQTDLSMEDILRSIGSAESGASQSPSNRPEVVQVILNQFVAARVLIHTDDDKYNLVHDYLAPYVRTATEGTETNTEHANRILKRYVAEYKEDPNMRIPFGRLRSIKKYASAEVKSKDKAQELIKKSQRTFYIFVAAFVMPLIVLLSLYFFYLTQAYYFSIDNSYVVLRAGSPQFTFLPRFGQVVIQTDFKREDLKDDHVREEIDHGEVSGFWFSHTERGYRRWGEQLEIRLGIIQQAQMIRLLGYPDRASKILIKTITDPEADSNSRSYAVSALSSLAQVKPEVVTADMLQSMMIIITDLDADSNSRSYAISALGSLAQVKPEIVTSDMLQAMMTIITNSKSMQEDYYWRSNAIHTLTSLAQAKPELLTSDMLQVILTIITDPEENYYSRGIAVSALSSLVQARPDLLTSDMLQSMINIIISSKADYNLRSSALSTLCSLAQARPEFFTSDMLQAILTIITTPEENLELRSEALDALNSLTQAKPEAVTSDIFQTMMTTISSPEKGYISRAAAIYTLKSLAQARPEFLTSDMLQAMLIIVYNSKEDYYLRSDALDALESLAQARPEFLTSDMLQEILTFITDPNEDYYLRSDALDALESLAQARPEFVTPDLLQRMIDIIANPKADYRSRSHALGALGTLAQAKTEAVTPDILQAVLTIITDSEVDASLRYSALNALSSLAQTRPEFITSDMLQDILNVIADPRADYSMRSSAISALSSLGQAKPEVVTSEMLQAMLSIFTDPNSEMHSNARDTLVTLIEAKPLAVTPEMRQTMISLCRFGKDSSIRQSAARLLFVIAILDPAQYNAIHDVFTQLQASPQPHLRMNGSRGMEMLAIGNLLEEARLHPNRIMQIRSKLNSYQEVDLKFAAFVVLNEIAKMENKIK